MIPILSPVPKFLFGIPWPREAEHAEQVHRTLVFGIALLFWAPIFTPIFYTLGSPRGAAMIVVSADRKSTRLNSSHIPLSRMPSSA